tara:strand:+ start:312 stop:1868 length:1557 start_codon:yes stop_codon:yes gene_type:complete
MVIFMKNSKLFFTLVLTLLFSINEIQACASDHIPDVKEHDPFSELMTNPASMTKFHKLNEFLGGFSEEADAATQEAYFAKLRDLRDGKVPGIHTDDFVSLFLLSSELRALKTPENHLNERAALNLANTLVRIAKHLKGPRASNMYQEAYCLYTLLQKRAHHAGVVKAATNNAGKLIVDNQITQADQRELVPAVKTVPEAIARETTEKHFDQLEEQFAPLESILRQTVIRAFEDRGIQFTPKMRQVMMKEARSVARRPDLLAIKERAIDDTVGKIASIPLPSPAEMEKEEAAKKPVAEIHVSDETFFDLYRLLKTVYNLSKQTLTLDGRKPLIVPLGRSVAWLVKLHEKLNPSDVQFAHILGSGLRNYAPLPEQIAAYKAYLDSLGFAEFVTNRELIFLDTAETGQSLITIQNLFEQMYPETVGHIQRIALMYSRTTIDLPQTRNCYLSPLLMELLFAKHSDRAGFSPYDVFYPQDWEKGDPMTRFEVPDGAQRIDAQLQAWVDAGKHKEVGPKLLKKL